MVFDLDLKLFRYGNHYEVPRPETTNPRVIAWAFLRQAGVDDMVLASRLTQYLDEEEVDPATRELLSGQVEKLGRSGVDHFKLADELEESIPAEELDYIYREGEV